MYGAVIRREQLTPHLVRVVLGGEGLADYEPSPHADSYVNCLFVPPAATYDVPFEVDATRELPREQRPYPRRITVRAWDAERGELTLDIAVHGDVGHAGRWANHARPGDRLQLKGPAGDYTPHADADSYLLVGDESALPAIASSAEAVPAGRPVVAVVEVADASGELELASPGDLTVHWVHRAGHGDPHGEDTVGLLADAVAALPSLPGTVSAFVHGEAGSVRAVRRVLLAGGVVDDAHFSCSPYWRRGMDDEQWRAVKGDWVREVNAETF